MTSSSHGRRFAALALLSGLVTVLPACSGGPSPSPRSEAARPPIGRERRFAEDVVALTARSRAVPEPPIRTLLVGSSIFRNWSSAAVDLPVGRTLNHGFGGARTWELVAYAEDLVVEFEPEVVVCYCGSNDVDAGESAESIAGRVEVFMDVVEQGVPGVRIVYVAINRAPQKRGRWGVVDAANSMIETICRAGPNRRFVDVNEGLFDAEGEPRLELYLEDGLHFRPRAYREVFGPAVRDALDGPGSSGSR